MFSNLLDDIKNDQAKQWINIKESIINQLNELKVAIETCNAETEENFKTAQEIAFNQLIISRYGLRGKLCLLGGKSVASNSAGTIAW